MKPIFKILLLAAIFHAPSFLNAQVTCVESVRERISINKGWRFFRYESADKSDSLVYDIRPEIENPAENQVADAKPTEAVAVTATREVLKPWILPAANPFIADIKKRHNRPKGNLGSNFTYVQSDFDDSSWAIVHLPHDWAIQGPFQTGPNPEVGGGMGRLPINGVAWYRKNLEIPVSDSGKSIFLDIDGAMSYTIVWLNGKIVGGWPYGYNSFRLDLTPYINFGGINQLAIRIDNPNHSARWYPGAGIYRNVWLTKTNPVHVAHWGTYITTKEISATSATLNLKVTIDNNSKTRASADIVSSVYESDINGNKTFEPVAITKKQAALIQAGESSDVESSLVINRPKYWGPLPTQQPHLYVAVTHDFHLIFPEWSEPDLRAFVRRDRNCPSVILWSFGNEVGEQFTDSAGAKVAKRLYDILKEEDPYRPATIAMNFSKPEMPLSTVPDVIGLNYQGEGIRQDPEFEGTDRIRTAPQYNAFHARFPGKMIFSSETASAFSSRGVYLFPVTPAISSPTRDGRGGDSKIAQVSAYELYAVDFGSSADKVFQSLEKHKFVAGEFVWTGWDYLGEPTPYYDARSSYTGIIDLAGFKKDRFYLYQAHWRPEYPMAHILPHWNWPERMGQITPVHVFTSGDEAELFLNGKSFGKKKKGAFEYRLRWDDVQYEPGELKVIA